MDGIKLSLIKYLLSHCTQHPNSSPAPAQTGAVQLPVCVGRPWPPHPSSCRNPRQPQGCQPCRGTEQGEQHHPNHFLIPTKASEKKDGQVRKPNTFFACSLPQMHICELQRVQGAGCWAQGAHPTRTPPASPHSRDRTWQRQQLRPEPLQVSPSSMNKSYVPSPAHFLAELMPCAPLGTQRLRRRTGRQAAREGIKTLLPLPEIRSLNKLLSQEL